VSSDQLASSDFHPARGEAPPPADRRLRQLALTRSAQRSSNHELASAGTPEALAPDADQDESDADLLAGASRSNRSWLKRLLDIAGAAAGLLVLCPFLFVVAVLIRLESRGPALFRQRRAGRGGEVFHIYKFRSMRVLEDGDHVVQATAADARITKLGAFLRRSCIDELPQLLNVLRGDMSLVGPRPHALAHDTHYSAVIPDYGCRLTVRPGIAGLAQVSGHRGATPTTESMAARVALDLEYISAWSMTMDIRILLRAVTEGPFHPAAY
jgi:putative colanic acid biosynthesis UDP-glucose lipid carrier transferase